MSSNMSSLDANNGSVESAGSHHHNIEFPDNNHTPSSTTTSSTSAAAAEERQDTSNLSAERITAYTTNSVDPNPPYTNNSAEASVAAHIAAVQTVLGGFDTVMNQAEEDHGDDKE